MHVFVAGRLSDIGGAGPHCWNVVRLLRSNGVGVTLIAGGPTEKRWDRECEALGVPVVHAESPGDVPGLAGETILAFCNSGFLAKIKGYKELGCKLVWSGCMTYLDRSETGQYEDGAPTMDRWIVNSEYQRMRVTPGLLKFGYKKEQIVRIPTPLFLDDMPFSPRRHEPETPFVIGRLSRASTNKFSSNTWKIYESIPHPIEARILGWDEKIERKLGAPPPWAECLPAGRIHRVPFLQSLHAMVHVSGGAKENRPRVCLEAMAIGVPVIVQNDWGWKELIHHGRTGFLCNDHDEFAHYTAMLARDEDRRMEIVTNARRILETEIVNHENIWPLWKGLLESLA